MDYEPYDAYDYDQRARDIAERRLEELQRLEELIADCERTWTSEN